MNGQRIEIVATSRAHAERLAEALREDFDAEVVSNHELFVRVTPDSETTAKLVALFNAIGTWLTDCELASCDVRFGERTLSVLAAAANTPGDPTPFLLERTRQLETALVSRIVIEQAKGVLAERRGLAVDDAFVALRDAARSSGRNIHEVAEEFIRSAFRGQ